MNHSHDEGRIGDPQTDVAQARAPYRKPVLEVFGSLTALTQGTSGSGGDANMLMIMSDPRCKQDVVRIGTHRLGMGVYLFSYRPEFRARCGAGRRIGFMADEVARVLPQAVRRGADGYQRVDYGLVAAIR